MRGGKTAAAIVLTTIASSFQLLTAGPARADTQPTWTRRTPPARIEHSVAYDAARGRTVLFGGRRYDIPATSGLVENLGDTWEWDGSTWTAFATPVAPSPRGFSAMAYDAARGKVVLFGGMLQESIGVSFQDHGDTWEWDGSTWVQLHPATSPAPRSGHAMAYDAARGRIVLFGGAGGGLLRDTWEFTGTTWVRRTTAPSPPAMQKHGLAYDSVRGKTVLFGGLDNTTSFGQTWEWNGNAWSLATPATSPLPRSRMGMTFDPVRSRTVIFGGGTGGQAGAITPLDDTWEWDGTTWVDRAPLRKPVARADTTMVYDAARGVSTVFFAIGDDDVWSWDGGAWTAGTPAARADHALAFDSARGEVVLFGGTFGATEDAQLSDTWVWDGAGWTQRSPAHSPSPRWGHAMAYDARRGRVVLFGGVHGTVVQDDLWEWDGTDWTEVNAAAGPSPRSGHAMTYDSRRERVVLYGGKGGDIAPDAPGTWEWDGTTWFRSDPALQPAQRQGHGMAFDESSGSVVLFGGNDGVLSNFADTWMWDGATWTLAESPVSPGPRWGAGMTYDARRGRVVLFGGSTGMPTLRLALQAVAFPGYYDDTWEWNGQVWSRADPAFSPGGRNGTAMAYDSARGRAVLFGGFGASHGNSADTWTYAAEPALTVTATVDKSQVGRGGTLVYEVEVENTTDLYGLETIVTAHIPDGTTLGPEPPCAEPAPPPGGEICFHVEDPVPMPGLGERLHQVVIELGPLGPQQKVSVQYAVTVDADAAIGSEVLNHFHAVDPLIGDGRSAELRTVVDASSPAAAAAAGTGAEGPGEPGGCGYGVDIRQEGPIVYRSEPQGERPNVSGPVHDTVEPLAGPGREYVHQANCAVLVTAGH